MTFSVEKGRFRWGVSIDDMWSYTGLSTPKSIVIPYVLSARFRVGTFRLPHDGWIHGRDHGRAQAHATFDTPRETPESRTRALAKFLKASGVDFVRCWFQWNFFERQIVQRPSANTEPFPSAQSSGYSFPLDNFVSTMSDAGIDIVAVIGNGYTRFLPVGLQTDHLDGYLRRLVESSTRIVRRYKDKIKVWQIENEPNWWRAHYSGNWRRGVIWLNPKNQEPILRALHGVVRTESPDSKIIINLEMDDWSANCALYSKYCDVLGLDFYPNYLKSAPIDGFPIGTIASAVKRQTGLPIYIIETGYPTGPRFLGFSEQRQKQYVHSACERAYSCDAISGLGWFRFSDSYWRSFPYQENHFGLITKEGKPKPAWGQFVQQIRAGA